MLEKMIWRHGKCGYKPLRDHACPSKIKTDDAQQMDSTVILVGILLISTSKVLPFGGNYRR